VANLKKRVERGLELRRRVMGQDDEAAWTQLNDSFDPEYHDYAAGFRWGTIMSRPGLDLRTRQLCTIATFLALGNFEQVGDTLERHIRGALRCGATPQEVVEVILQTGLWAGIYKWHARKIALRVFRDMGYKEGVDWGAPLPRDF
jgi:alkylhydroperoxidase/carboxymuconolactone decarboxylase family protein YurZ